ncbi:sigma-70 family RNA polymerase sigma factor [Isoptericola sediminis]|uniref:sigma-70 family RNA polymerase sigma factor n=1 Tax=Isoptericola sediminis TaxID=2733572 RepID=UPI0031B63D0D
MVETPSDLVARAVAGDEQALAQVIDTVRRTVAPYCRARLGSGAGRHTSADDVAQDVCEAVLVALPRARGPLLPFVYGIAAHKVADALRAAARSRHLVELDGVPEPVVDGTPEDSAMAADTSARLRGMLDRLPAVQRQVVVLRVLVGLSAAQAGRRLGMSAGAVRVAQHRGLRRLRDLAAEHPPDRRLQPSRRVRIASARTESSSAVVPQSMHLSVTDRP